MKITECLIPVVRNQTYKEVIMKSNDTENEAARIIDVFSEKAQVYLSYFNTKNPIPLKNDLTL